MPRGTEHVFTGLLLEGRAFPMLRVDGGGEWQLDLPGKYIHFIGGRVVVEGSRAGFNLLVVTRASEAPKP